MQSPQRSALNIAVGYFIAASLWIVASDELLRVFSRTPVVLIRLETLKGLGFVSITSILLYWITERSFRRLSRSEQTLRTVLEGMADGVLLIDSTLNVLDVNRAALEIIGSRATDFPSTLPEVVRKFDIRNKNNEPLPFNEYSSIRALRGEIVRGSEISATRTDGTQLSLALSAAPLSPIRGKPPIVVMTIRDITEKNRATVLKDEFLSVAAHELKTPLAVIKANSELLERFGARWPDEKKQLILGIIDRQCDKMAHLVQELLEGSRIQLGQMSIARVDFDLAEIVRKVAIEHPPSVKHPIAVEAPPSLHVIGDSERTEQVLRQLLSNAIRFSPSGSNIILKLERGKTTASVSVRDFGVGIAEEEKPRIFEKYFRGSTEKGTTYGGLGIGLNLARELVRRQGGDISFESQRGQGTVFQVSLPLSKEVSHERSA